MWSAHHISDISECKIILPVKVLCMILTFLCSCASFGLQDRYFGSMIPGIVSYFKTEYHLKEVRCHTNIVCIRI